MMFHMLGKWEREANNRENVSDWRR